MRQGKLVKEGLKTDPCLRCGLVAAELIYRVEYTFCPRCWQQFNFTVKMPDRTIDHSVATNPCGTRKISPET